MVADGKIVAQRWGKPPAQVVALHGWGRTRNDWEETLAGYNALALDLPGFGGTPMPEQVWGAREYARAVLPALPQQPVVLVGHSFGGRIAVHLAAMAPQRVRALVLTGVPLLRRPSAGKPAFRFRVVRFLARRKLIPASYLENMRDKYGSADYKAAQGVMRSILVRTIAESYEPEIAATQCPVSLVWAQQDRDVPLDIAKQAQEIFADATLTVVPDTSHLLSPPLHAALRTAIDQHLDA